MRRILPFLLLALAGCGVDGDAGDTTLPTTSAPTTTAVVEESTTTTDATTTTTAPIDAASALGDAVAATGRNYRFVSTVTVGEAVVTTIDGLVDGSSVQADITTGETTVSYIRTADGEWTRETDGDWVQLEGTPPVEPPLAPMGDPQDVTLIGADGQTLLVTGRLGETAGAAAGVEFSASITDGLISEIAYQAETGGQSAAVATTLSEIGSAGSVETPTTDG